MSSIFGDKIKVSIFGESHGVGIGVVLDGLPPAEQIDMDKVLAHMKRRAPGNAKWATPRKEADSPEILSGFYQGKTTGTPLAAIIRNTNTRSEDYDALSVLPRPGHADITGCMRYKGANDPRGGGHFSGRLTAPIVFAGAICLQILERRGIRIHARIKEIGGIKDIEVGEAMHPFSVADKDFPVIDDVQGEEMIKAIAESFSHGDSLGGIVECVACGMPSGIGNPIFDGIESRIASGLFSIPAVKGVEFGLGFGVAKSCGSKNNDEPYFMDDGKIRRKTNNAGGIEGGISNGMPIVCRCAFKPTPSISSTQQTINLKDNTTAELNIKGRHDPCIVPRAVPVVESVVAMVLLDMLESSYVE